MKDKVIKTAEQEEGYLQKSAAAVKKNPSILDSRKDGAGSDNYTKYLRDIYKSYQGEPWCNAFVNWVFIKAFEEKEAKRLLYVNSSWRLYTPTWASYFKSTNAWDSKPLRGDIIYFKNSQRIHHVGIVYNVDSNYVYTIEGNTSSGSEVVPNGGGVYKKKYVLSNSAIAGYGRPAYSGAHQIAQVIAVGTGRKGMKVLANLNIRDNAGTTDSCIIGKYNINTYVFPIARTRKIEDQYWFKTDKGFISGKYLQGWVSEQDVWWYIDGGKYPVSEWKEIDGVYYYFMADGYMAADTYVKSADKDIWYYLNKDGAWDTRKDVTIKPRNVVK